MNLRLAILALTDKYQLSAQQHAELKQLAGLGAPPPLLARQLQAGMAVLGAALGGLGILFWLAANWQSLSGAGRFGLLQAVLIAALLGAWLRPAARVPLSLLGFMTCGGLFAHFGQTYQTGADPWQLFALWAALTLPLCLNIRHAALWTVWAAVALTAAWLACAVVPGRGVFHNSLGSWIPAITLAAAFRFAPIGAGLWPMRLSMIYATAGLCWVALYSLFENRLGAAYLLTLACVAALGYLFSLRRMFDVFVLSALGFGANVLLVSGLARAILDDRQMATSAILLTGCIAAGLLAATVKLIVHLTRTHTGEHIA
ncbi:DUF2157 domain-containing protein [Pseudoduganella sp. FT25W]|uniref:DUF2157 domain-containing protein n=1 Tax=Duganella alba TaxID=2666081 RepID=A0A6L5QLF1_9BURK|nr:DUF2157 domain-containing protein [Duganella alba]MRX10663.1 DUF2157 domain-containing protein [Duganella alba]MRX18694.1 DUF2157 domain-containing protein [Duganella alba]